MDDDDDFIYGGPKPEAELTVTAAFPPTEPTPISVDKVQTGSNGLVAQLEARAEEQATAEEAASNAGEEEEEEEDSDDDDIEIITEPRVHSLDFRQNRPSMPRAGSSAINTPQRAPPGPSLTTEYTPRERGAPVTKQPSAGTPQPQPQPQAQPQLPEPTPASTPTPSAQEAAPEQETTKPADDGPDPSTLPPVTAPASHPKIDPTAPGAVEGRSIYDVDLSNLAEKSWRRPGADIADWFNYGFDELSWEAYCVRRRDLGEMAAVLKANLINFSGMPEEQLLALPPDVRQMAMASANALMNGGGNSGMMPMMDMSGMQQMNMMGMNGMNGDMMPQAGMMGDGAGPGGMGPDGGMMNMQEGFVGAGPGMGNMMGNEFGMQDVGAMNQGMNPAMGQNMYPGMEGSSTPIQAPIPGRGVPYRGRGGNMGPMRGGRGGYGGRGRGGAGAGPVRAASPLPPNVPTGPRNQNKYKDRDNNGPAVEGLDYGGGRDSAGDNEDRYSGRKRRGSPDYGDSDVRGSKRR